MMKDSEVLVKSKLQNPLQSTTSELIYGIKGHTNVWGLKSMVQVIDPDCVRKIQKVTENCIPSNIDTAAHELYTVSLNSLIQILLYSFSKLLLFVLLPSKFPQGL